MSLITEKADLKGQVNRYLTLLSSLEFTPVSLIEDLQYFKGLVEFADPSELESLYGDWSEIRPRDQRSMAYILDRDISKLPMPQKSTFQAILALRGGSNPDNSGRAVQSRKMVLRHLAGKHNQKTHGTGGGKGAVRSVSPERKEQGKASKQSQDAKSKKFGWRSKAMANLETEIAGASRESAAAYDKNGKELFKIGGKQSEVNFSDDQLRQMKGAIVTHNHPSTINGKKYPDGGSFSPSDIQLMLNTGAAEVRAVTENYIYRVRPKLVGGQPVRNALNFLDRRKAKVQSSLSKEYQKGKMTKEAYAVEFWHQLWQGAADEGLLEYERIDR